MELSQSSSANSFSGFCKSEGFVLYWDYELIRWEGADMSQTHCDTQKDLTYIQLIVWKIQIKKTRDCVYGVHSMN